MQLTILYIGRDPGITEVMQRLLNAKAEWRGLTTCSDDEALSFCMVQAVDLVLFGNGISDAEENLLRANLNQVRPGLKIVQHYGGGSGLLYGEIMAAVSGK